MSVVGIEAIGDAGGVASRRGGTAESNGATSCAELWEWCGVGPSEVCMVSGGVGGSVSTQ